MTTLTSERSDDSFARSRSADIFVTVEVSARSGKDGGQIRQGGHDTASREAHTHTHAVHRTSETGSP